MTRPLSDAARALPAPEAMTQALRQALPQFPQADWLAQTGSTNIDLMARARSGSGSLMRPWLLGSHLQSQGRGRAGRTWQNRAGANLMFSCAFDIFLPTRQLPTLSPLIGMASCQALRALIGAEHQRCLTMKWPNDLQWNQAKLAGILIESTRSGTARTADHHLIIIGIGLNLQDARSLSQSLDRRIADWDEIAAADPTAAGMTPARLAEGLARAWYDTLNQATATGITDLPVRFADVDGLAGQILDVLDDGQLRQTGAACGIDTEGRLLLRNAAGQHAISVGEISVRPQR